MNWELDDDQKMLRSSIDAWARQNDGRQVPAGGSRDEEAALRSRWKALAELGVAGLAIEETYGGLGLGVRELQLAAEVAGSRLLPDPFLPTLVLGAGIVARAGSEAQKQAILPSVVDGTCLLAFAFAEHGNRYDLRNVATELRGSGDELRLAGSKIAVLNGHIADKLIVLARDARSGAPGDGGLVLCLVDRTSVAGRTESYRMIDARSAADIDLDGVAVEAILDAAAPEAVLDEVEATALAYLAMEAVGAMNAVCDHTLEYLRTREQFGQTLSTYQALRHRFVDMVIARDSTEAIAIKAGEALRLGLGERLSIAMAAKATSGRCGRFVGAQGIQLHGGIGMTDELVIGRHYKQLMANDVILGNAEHHAARFRAAQRS